MEKTFMWWVQEDGTAISVEVRGRVKTGAYAVRVCESNVYHLVTADELQSEHPYW